MVAQTSTKYGEMLQIDPLKLEDEWMDQPGLYLFWAERAAVARANADRARFDFEKTEAELSTDVRAYPGNYDLEKVTETSITNAVRQDSAYEKAYSKRIDANMTSDVLSKVVAALEQRKKALENLAFLHSAGFNAQPTERRKKRRIKK